MIKTKKGDDALPEISKLPQFMLLDLSVTASKVYRGDTLTVEVVLTNNGGMSGTFPLELEIDGVTIEVREVTLGAGETRTITFTATVLVPGTHLLRTGEWSAMFEVLPLEQAIVSSGFSVSDLSITPAAAGRGEKVGITAKVTNDGSTAANGSFILYINGTQEDTRDVTLDPGDSAMVAFEVSRNVAGTYHVALGSENGEFTIRPVKTEVVGKVAGSETEEETGIDIGGLVAILIGALLAIALIVAVLYSRRRD